jgi:DNA recombination protein RmuC
MSVELWVALAAAAAAGAAIVALFIKGKQVAALHTDLAQRQEQLTAARAENAALARDNKWLGESDQKLRDTFQALAAEALKDNRSSFLDLARTSFEKYQQPISETLRQVDLRLGEAERDRIAAYSRLAEQIGALGATTNSLSRALHTPAVRGRWGEMQLKRVVEIAGMLEQCDFDEQPALYSDNGRLRPDLIVRLPGAKQIVVDAKAPLEAFLDAQDARDEGARTARLQAHARQVREHMDKLGSKAYWDQLGNSPEMVVMFLPGETLFSAALQQDLTLIEHGLEQKVLLASPITLIALLTTIAHTWRQEALTRNYRVVAQLGKEFYERLTTFIEHFEDVRKKLDGAVQAYNKAAGSFETRVLVSARKLKDMDVTTAEELPPLEPIDSVPRVLKQANLMGLPEMATLEEEDVTSQPT